MRAGIKLLVRLLSLTGLLLASLSVPQLSDCDDGTLYNKDQYGGGALYSKDDYIADIVDELRSIYADDRIIAGKRITITIKDFSVTDEETYVIVEGADKTVEGPNHFWIITLPEGRKKVHGPYINVLCVCKSFPLEVARKDLVAKVRKNGIVKGITVPQYRNESGKELIK